MTDDLWPDDIQSLKYSDLRPPVAILKEQGTLLGRKTDNLVEGEVVRVPGDFLPEYKYDFAYIFYLVAPALSDYRYKLLDILHSVDFYPLLIGTGDDVLGELPAEMEKGKYDRLVADSQDRFIEILRAIFATKKVRRVIEAIIAQSGVGIEQE